VSSGTEAYFLGGRRRCRRSGQRSPLRCGDDINILDLQNYFFALNEVYIIQPNKRKFKTNYCIFLNPHFLLRA
jgi:hypothetical protein